MSPQRRANLNSIIPNLNSVVSITLVAKTTRCCKVDMFVCVWECACGIVGPERNNRLWFLFSEKWISPVVLCCVHEDRSKMAAAQNNGLLTYFSTTPMIWVSNTQELTKEYYNLWRGLLYLNFFLLSIFSVDQTN